MQVASTLIGLYSTYRYYIGNNNNIVTLPDISPKMTLEELNTLIQYLDVEETLKNVKNYECFKLEGIYECVNVLEALTQSHNRLSQNSSKMWILSSYRIGDVSGLAKDINLWNHKLLTRLHLVHLQVVPIQVVSIQDIPKQIL